MLRFISIPVLIISFIIGMVFSYGKEEDEENRVYVYPSPNTIKKYQWIDKANNCYGWSKSEVICPENPDLIQKIPIQN